MRTIEQTVYNFNELSESAKANAHHDWLAGGFEHHWIDESLDSVRAFCDLFGIKMSDWSLGTCSYSYIDTDAEQEDFRGIKTNIVEPNTDLTGYYLDYGLCYAFCHYVKEHGDIKGAFFAAIDQAVRDIVRDMEYQESMTAFAETCEINEYEFYENGGML